MKKGETDMAFLLSRAPGWIPDPLLLVLFMTDLDLGCRCEVLKGNRLANGMDTCGEGCRQPAVSLQGSTPSGAVSAL